MLCYLSACAWLRLTERLLQVLAIYNNLSSPLTKTYCSTELLTGSMWNLLHDKSVAVDVKLQLKLVLDTAKGMVRAVIETRLSNPFY